MTPNVVPVIAEVEHLWPAEIRAELLPEVVTLEQLGAARNEAYSFRSRAGHSLRAVNDAILLFHEKDSHQSLRDTFSSLRTHSYPDVVFQTPDGSLSVRGFKGLLEFAQERYLDFALKELGGYPNEGEFHFFTSLGPVQILHRAGLLHRDEFDPADAVRHFHPFHGYGYHLSSISMFNPDRPADERLQDLQSIFCEIVDQIFDGQLPEDEEEMAWDINACSFSTGDPDSKLVRGYDFMDLARDTLQELSLVKYGDERKDCLNQIKNYIRTIKYLTTHALGRRMTRAEELSLFAAFDYQPAKVFQAWSLVHGTPMSFANRKKFVARYPGLVEENPTEYFQKVYPEHTKPKSPRKFLVDLVMRASKKDPEIIASPGRVKYLSELLLALTRRDIQTRGRSAVLKTMEESQVWFERLAERHSNARGAAFLAEAHSQAAACIAAPLTFVEPKLKLKLQEYQKEGAAFLVNRKRAILGDSYSLGKTTQAIAAAESAGVEQVVWITEASNRSNIRDEILKTVDIDKNRVVEILPPSEWGNRSVEFPKDAKYVVVSYSTLVAIAEQAKTSLEWERFQMELRVATTPDKTEKIRALVLNESQLADNPNALRSKEVYSIDTEYAFLLSATPFQNRIDSLYHPLHFLDPDRFESLANFRAEFLQDEEGFELFLDVFSNYFLGREQAEVGLPFEDLKEVPLEEQLAVGVPRFARMNTNVAPDLDRVNVPQEVAHLYLWMLTDFVGWANYQNAVVHPQDPEKFPFVDLSGNIATQKLGYLMRALYEPQKYGLSEPTYLYEAAARLGERYLAEDDKKIIYFGQNLSVLYGVQNELGDVSQVFCGDSSYAERDLFRHGFENDQYPEGAERDEQLRALILQAQAGGLGLSFRRADAVINIQPFQSISQFGQAHGRVPRNVYPGEVETPGLAKVEIPITILYQR